MNLYDRIKPGKRRRGWGGAVFLAAACVVLVICIGTIGWAARYHQRYRRFSTDFAASVENAGKIGAALDLWEVEIPEETAKNPTGVFVRYTFADGTVYQYDTDQIQMNEVRLALGLH